MSGDSSGNGWTVVTGASSGIGLAFARELARPGHRVLAVARRRDRLEALAGEPVEQGGSIVPLAPDLRTGEGLALVIERIACLGTIDLLVNNAGVATFSDFQNSSLDQESLTACEHVALLRVTPKLSLLQPSLSPGFQREHLIRK